METSLRMGMVDYRVSGIDISKIIIGNTRPIAFSNFFSLSLAPPEPTPYCKYQKLKSRPFAPSSG
jgi:hypothetical protein